MVHRKSPRLHRTSERQAVSYVPTQPSVLGSLLPVHCVPVASALIDESELFFQRAEWYRLSPQEVYFDCLANYWAEAPLPGFVLEKTFDITQPGLGHFEVPKFSVDVMLRAGQSLPPQLKLVRK